MRSCGIFGDAEGASMQVKLAVAMRPSDANILYNAACTYGLLGMKVDALDTFRRSVEAGYSNTDWCTQDPDLKILHEDPEFKKLVGKRAPKPT
jgi:non-specific serine/threonine protein kinase